MKNYDGKAIRLPLMHILVICGIAVLLLMGTAMGEISKPGLVGEWHFDEGSGIILKDSSGNGNDGTIYGATFVDGKLGKALSFNGKDNYAISSKFLNYPTISVEIWIKITSYSESQIISKWNDDSNSNQRGWYLFQDSSGKIGFAISRDGKEWQNSTGDPIIPNLNTPYHYVSTYDGNDMKLYRNGEVVGNAFLSGTIFSNQANLLFGIGKETTNYRAFNGIIDEVRIYNRALNADEVKANYEAGQIMITSSPSNAEVRIDGQSKGNASPTLTVFGTSPGSHAVKCKLAGYSDYDANVVLSASSALSINCELKLAPSTPTPTPPPTPTPTPTPSPTPTPTLTPTLTPTPTPTTPTTALITGNVMDTQTDKPLQDATITIDGNSTITGSDGEYQLVVSSGNHNITVNKSGYETRTISVNVSGAGTVDLSITQIPPSTPLWSILILVIILVLAAIILYLWTKDNLQLIPKQTSLPCDGKSTLPIKVQFINTFGKTRKQGKDRDIEMETTSGKIQNVVIPARKEFAEATLTSSTEGGTVTITAKSGKQKTTTQVNFVCEETRIEVDVSSAAIPSDGSSTATVTIKSKDATGKYITSLNERTVDVTTTLGTITSPVTIPPKTLAGIAIITSGQVSGTAIITASIGLLKGEGKIVFAELPKRYCMHCGAPMAMDAKSCPVCRNIPPSGVDTRQCGTCSAILPLTAKFCDKCGAKQPM